MSIKNCDFVSIEGEAFSWLLTMSISNVHKMELGKGSFMLDPTADNVGAHGPGMSVSMFFSKCIAIVKMKILQCAFAK